MEKIYPYIDIIFLVLIVVFLLGFFLRMMGKKSGLQKEDLSKKQATNTAMVSNSTKSLGLGIEENKFKHKEENNSLDENESFAIGSLNYKISKIKQKDFEFNIKKFIASSKKAFELIITNFNKGSLEEIKPFVTKDLYSKFSNYHNDNNTSDMKSVKIEEFLIADIIDAEVTDDNLAKIKVKFLTKQRIESSMKEMNEVWIFVKSLTQSTTIWKLSSISTS